MQSACRRARCECDSLHQPRHFSTHQSMPMNTCACAAAPASPAASATPAPSAGPSPFCLRDQPANHSTAQAVAGAQVWLSRKLFSGHVFVHTPP